MGCHRGFCSHADWPAAEDQEAEARIQVMHAKLKQVNGSAQRYIGIGQIGRYCVHLHRLAYERIFVLMSDMGKGFQLGRIGGLSTFRMI